MIKCISGSNCQNNLLLIHLEMGINTPRMGINKTRMGINTPRMGINTPRNGN